MYASVMPSETSMLVAKMKHNGFADSLAASEWQEKIALPVPGTPLT